MERPKKFKIGDLVTLSAAGKQRKGNVHTLNGFGMITSISKRGTFPIACSWYGGSTPTSDFKEYELKRYRGEK